MSSGAQSPVMKTLPPGLERIDWLAGWIYTGSRQQLLDACIVPFGTAFPGDTPRKRVVRFRDLAGRTVMIEKAGGARFSVTLTMSGEEIAASKWRKEVADRRRELQQQFDAMPVDAAAFRKMTSVQMTKIIEAIIGSFDGWHGAYRFTDQSICEIRSGIGQVLQRLQTLPVAVDHSQPRRVRAALAAKSDTTLQEVLGRAFAARPLKKAER